MTTPAPLSRSLFTLSIFYGGMVCIAGVLSQIVDTLIFITVAFYGEFPIGHLLMGQMLAKVVLSIVLIPALIAGFDAIGRSLDRAAPDN